MTWAISGSGAGHGIAAGNNYTSPTPITGADLIFAYCGIVDAGLPTPTVQDVLGNSFTLVDQQNNSSFGGIYNVATYVCQNPSVSSSYQIRMNTLVGTGDPGFVAYLALQGSLPSGSLDSHNQNKQAGVNTLRPVPGAGTIGVIGEALVAFATCQDASATSFSVDSGFTIVDSIFNNGGANNTYPVTIAWLEDVTGLLNPAFTSSSFPSSFQWLAAIGSFLPAPNISTAQLMGQNLN